MTEETRERDEQDTEDGFLFGGDSSSGSTDSQGTEEPETEGTETGMEEAEEPEAAVPEETAFTFRGPDDGSVSDSTPDDEPVSDPVEDTDDTSLPAVERSLEGEDTELVTVGSEQDPGQDGDPSDDRSTGSREGPLGDLAERVRDRETDDDEFDELFDREDVEEIDREELWEQVEGTDDPFEDVTVEREVRRIPKEKYCHQCEHFSEPPAVACENEGTDILELIDLETFLVADCPVVLKDERLEEG